MSRGKPGESAIGEGWREGVQGEEYSNTLHNVSGILMAFRSFRDRVERETGCRMTWLGRDSGREYWMKKDADASMTRFLNDFAGRVEQLAAVG